MAVRYVDGIGNIIKQRLDIVEVIKDYVDLKKAGRNYKGLCPFHNEKTPSFVVNEDRQTFHCFGCGEGGDAIGFVMKRENFDFIDAIEHLSERFGIDLQQYRGADDAPRKDYSPVYEMNKAAARFYYSNLQKSKEAKSYFLLRGLSEATIKKFGLGYAPDGWTVLYDMLKPGYRKEYIDASGLFIFSEKKKDYYDRFRNRVIFPIFDIRMRVIGFGGRVVDDSLPKYLNSPDTPVFNKSYNLFGLNYAKNESAKSGVIFLVEGYLDVISLYDKGVRNAVASLGTAFTEGHAALLKRYSKKVIVLYDGDSAGVKATLKAVDILRKAAHPVEVVNLPEKMDPDDYIKNNGKEGFLSYVQKNRIDGTGYMLRAAMDGLDMEKNNDKKIFLERISPVMKDISTATERDLYLSWLSKVVSVEKSVLEKDYRSGFREIEKRLNREVKKYDIIETIVRRLVSIIYHERRYVDVIVSHNHYRDILHDELVEIAQYFDNNKTFDFSTASDILSFESLELIAKARDDSYFPAKGEKEIDRLVLELVFNELELRLAEIKKDRDRSLETHTGDNEDDINREYTNMINDLILKRASIKYNLNN